MTGAEHYREAEKCVQQALSATPEEIVAASEIVALKLQQAQVHATLALTAATVQDVDLWDVTS